MQGGRRGGRGLWALGLARASARPLPTAAILCVPTSPPPSRPPLPAAWAESRLLGSAPPRAGACAADPPFSPFFSFGLFRALSLGARRNHQPSEGAYPPEVSWEGGTSAAILQHLRLNRALKDARASGDRRLQGGRHQWAQTTLKPTTPKCNRYQYSATKNECEKPAAPPIFSSRPAPSSLRARLPCGRGYPCPSAWSGR